jgi:hypothetical protein
MRPDWQRELLKNKPDVLDPGIESLLRSNRRKRRALRFKTAADSVPSACHAEALPKEGLLL